MAVEFALLLPLLILLVGGAIGWGDAMAREVALVQVARDAALAAGRTASTDAPATVARDRALEGLDAAGFDVAAATVTVTPVTLTTGAALEVRVTSPAVWLLELVPLPEALNAATTARLDDQ